MNASELIIGQRYWLDKVKDVSAVYLGRDYRNRVCFKEPEGNNCYSLDSDGTIGFSGNPTHFFLINGVEDHAQELLTRLYNLVNAVDGLEGFDATIELRRDEARELIKKLTP